VVCKALLKSQEGPEKSRDRSKVKVLRENAYSCNLGIDSR